MSDDNEGTGKTGAERFTEEGHSGKFRWLIFLIFVVAISLFNIYERNWSGLWRFFRSIVVRFTWEIGALIVLLLAFCAWEWWKSRPSKNCECGREGRFRLMKGNPAEASNAESYCLEHFLPMLSTAFDKYDGTFLVLDRPLPGEPVQGQYLFYRPGHLKDDSFDDSDIKRVRKALREVTPTDGFCAVRILTYRADHSDDPLFEPEAVEQAELFDRREFMVFLENKLAPFNREKCRFRMNLPYSKTGIYIWHDYL